MMRLLVTALTVAVAAIGAPQGASALTVGAWHYDVVLLGDLNPDTGRGPSVASQSRPNPYSFSVASPATITITDAFLAGDLFRVRVIGESPGATDGRFEVTPTRITNPGGVDPAFNTNFAPQPLDVDTDAQSAPFFESNPPGGIPTNTPVRALRDEDYASAQIEIGPGEYSLRITSGIESRDNPSNAGGLPIRFAAFFIRIDLDTTAPGVIPLPGGAVLLLTSLGAIGLLGRRRRKLAA